MDNESSERRNSRALIPTLIIDPIKRAEAEAANGLLQYDAGIAVVLEALERIEDGNKWRLRPSLITGLQRLALQGVCPFAGNYRPSSVEIEKSKHTPPEAHRVAELVEDLCDYVNDNWHLEPLHLAAYVLWRLNFAALDAADLCLKQTGEVDVSAMRKLLISLLAKQLATVLEIAGGISADELVNVLNGT